MSNVFNSFLALAARIGRLVFWLGLFYIVGHAVMWSLAVHDYWGAALKLAFFWLTYMIYPWYSGLWWVWLLSVAGFWLSIFVGGKASGR